MTVEAAGLKSGVAAGLLVLGLIGTCAPKCIYTMSPAVFSMGNMLAAGVLLAGGLVHMLHDAEGVLSEKADFPWANFICGCSFAVFLILEESLHLVMEGDHDQCEDDHEHGHPQASKCSAHNSPNWTMHQETLVENEYGHSHEHGHADAHGHNDSHGHEYGHSAHQTDAKNPPSPLLLGRTSSFASTMSEGLDQRPIDHHHHDSHIEAHLHGSLIASVALLLALSIHSMLAGFSLGLDDAYTAESTAIAIFAHKAFAGYALGSTLTASEKITTCRYLLMASIFSLSTPVGIFVALVMSEVGLDLDGIGVAVIKAAVAGTFIYIAIIEVAMKELLVCRVQSGASVLDVGKRLEIGKLTSFVVGYGLMSMLAIWV